MTKLILKAMGARVNTVDEEGHVTLFCYAEDEQITINAGTV